VLLAHYVEQQGVEVIYADIETGDDPNLKQDPFDCVCFLAHDPQTTYSHTGKKYRQKLYFNLAKGSTVIDPWRCFKDKDFNVVFYGAN